MASVKNKSLRSILKQFISDECYLDLYRVTILNCDNNGKILEAKRVLQKYNVPFDGLGSGTNRFAVMIDGYAIKIAVDEDGMIDNKREFKYSTELYPYVTKTYECTPSGLLLVCEYVNVFDEFTFRQKKEEMKDILSAISKRYLIGDVGYTLKNYINWGYRQDGSICILDFAYIYDLSYKVFTCSCNNISMVQYDENFTSLKCPSCGRKYTFGEIRMKITREQQKKEIGDIRTQGYVLKSQSEEVPYNPKFEPEDLSKKKKKKSKVEDKQKEIDKRLKEQYESYGTPVTTEGLSEAEIRVLKSAGILE